MDRVDVMILGAGIAGLGAALRAKELGRSAVVYEAGASAGGLLDNFVVDGFRFDNAVHLSFASEPKVREIFDRTPYNTHPAESRCFDDGLWLKHPVQNNLNPLPARRKVELIKSFLAREELGKPDNYEQWLRRQYGDMIAESYPIAYTYKYWGTSPSQLSTTWIGSRMRRAEIDEILLGSFTDETPHAYYTKEMRYPRQGGYKAFIQPLIDTSDIRFNSRAVAVNTIEKLVRFESGEEVTYTKLISTLPLPMLVEMLDGVPGSVLDAARTLDATSIDLVSVAFSTEIDLDLWFYIYDAEIFASRAYSPSVKSRFNVPAGCSSLQFEIYQRGRNARFTPEELINNTLAGIKKMKLATESQILFTHHKRLPWGNVIFDKGMEAQRGKVRDYLVDASVSSCGRFGEWDYLWSNQSFLSGYGAFDHE